MEMSPVDVVTYIQRHPKEIAEALLRDHRTNQQMFWTSVRKVIFRYADYFTEYGCDLRNEACVEWTKQVKKDSYTPEFPFI